jgi:hypothetical protein
VAAWASDLKDLSGNAVGVEFATSSVTSPGFEAIFTTEEPTAFAAALTQLIGPCRLGVRRHDPETRLHGEHRAQPAHAAGGCEPQVDRGLIRRNGRRNFLRTTADCQLNLYGTCARAKLLTQVVDIGYQHENRS